MKDRGCRTRMAAGVLDDGREEVGAMTFVSTGTFVLQARRGSKAGSKLGRWAGGQQLWSPGAVAVRLQFLDSGAMRSGGSRENQKLRR